MKEVGMPKLVRISKMSLICRQPLVLSRIWLFSLDTLFHARRLGCAAILLASCWMSAGASITYAQAEDAEIRLADDVSVRRLAEGVWLHTTYFDTARFRRVPANGLVVVEGREAIMIDLPWTDEQTGALFDWAARERGAAIGKVVATHSHIDCAGGLAEAHRRGADSFALEKTVEILRKADKPAARNWFSQRMSLGCGDTRVELAFHGGGHTVDNIVVWIPAKKVLFGGCLMKSQNAKNLGNITEADLTGYPNTLKKVKEKYSQAKIVVPGHGSPGTMDLLEHTIALCKNEDG